MCDFDAKIEISSFKKILSQLTNLQAPTLNESAVTAQIHKTFKAINFKLRSWTQKRATLIYRNRAPNEIFITYSGIFLLANQFDANFKTWNLLSDK